MDNARSRLAGDAWRLLRASCVEGPWAAMNLFHDLQTLDRRYGIETSDFVNLERLDVVGENRRLASRYEPTNMLVLRRAFELLPARLKAGTFVDFGCGKGRTLIYAALSGFRRIVGVEFARDIASRCRANIETFLAAEAGIEAEIEVVEGDAAEFAIPDEATVFYFFNPFQRPLAERVVDNIQSSLCRDRRDACIVYVTLIYPEVFDGTVFRKRRSFGRDNAIYTPTWMKL